jgi:hypothetical protein
MAINAGSCSRSRHGITLTVKSTALLAAIAAFGYIAFNVVEHEWPLLEASAGYALESQMSTEVAKSEAPNRQRATERTSTDGGY